MKALDSSPDPQLYRVRSDALFYVALGAIGGAYVLLILAMLGADVAYMLTSQSPGGLDPAWAAEQKYEMTISASKRFRSIPQAGTASTPM